MTSARKFKSGIFLHFHKHGPVFTSGRSGPFQAKSLLWGMIPSLFSHLAQCWFQKYSSTHNLLWKYNEF